VIDPRGGLELPLTVLGGKGVISLDFFLIKYISRTTEVPVFDLMTGLSCRQ
jgi:hypothetical protein